MLKSVCSQKVPKSKCDYNLSQAEYTTMIYNNLLSISFLKRKNAFSYVFPMAPNSLNPTANIYIYIYIY